MLSDEFKDNPKEEDESMQETLEKTPGVYVRSNDHAANELDLLWSGARHFKDERSPVLFFIAGLLMGVVATAAVFFFLFYKPTIQTGENDLTVPVTDDKDAAAKQPQNARINVPHPGQTSQGFAPTASSVRPVSSNAPQGVTAATSGTQTHKVQSGETLEQIARHYYGSGTPEYVEKITRANKLNNPNSLMLDQALVIPPKNY